MTPTDFRPDVIVVGAGLAGLVATHELVKAGRRVHVWTVNDEAGIDLCLDLGVEAVITDRPVMALGHLNGGAPHHPVG